MYLRCTVVAINSCIVQVLVDVPCYTDRHVLMEDDNNLFRPSRMQERLQIQETQKQLLVYELTASLLHWHTQTFQTN